MEAAASIRRKAMDVGKPSNEEVLTALLQRPKGELLNLLQEMLHSEQEPRIVPMVKKLLAQLPVLEVAAVTDIAAAGIDISMGYYPDSYDPAEIRELASTLLATR